MSLILESILLLDRCIQPIQEEISTYLVHHKQIFIRVVMQLSKFHQTPAWTEIAEHASRLFLLISSLEEMEEEESSQAFA